jgi:hypothetical protein
MLSKVAWQILPQMATACSTKTSALCHTNLSLATNSPMSGKRVFAKRIHCMIFAAAPRMQRTRDADTLEFCPQANAIALEFNHSDLRNVREKVTAVLVQRLQEIEH